MCNNYRDSPNRFYIVADLEQLLLSYLSLQEIIPTQVSNIVTMETAKNQKCCSISFYGII